MKHVPNIITCLNLLAGCMACVMALKFDSYTGAFVFIIMAAVFDFLDGLAARMLNAYSKIGEQLDSLADVVSFGAAPGFIVYSYLSGASAGNFFSGTLPILAFLLPIFSAVRLAKFNIDTRQKENFLGLPVPANGIFWSSFILSLSLYSHIQPNIATVVIIVLVLVMSMLMVSEIPMFSLKFKSMSWKGNEWPLAFVLLSLVVILVMSSFGLFFAGVCSVIVLYILMSIIKSIL